MNEKNKLSVIIYYSYIYRIGGVESWIYYFCQNLCDYYNITVMFDNGNIEQLKRINKYVNVKRSLRNENYYCDVLITASKLDKFPENIKSKKVISMVHSDYKKCDFLTKNSNIVCEHADEIVSVSELAAKSLNDVFNKDSIVIPNILGKKMETNHILHLVSFTRLSKEKGYDRMCFLIKKLKENNIKFDWKIFSDIENINEIHKIQCPEVIFMNPTLDIIDYIVDSDYLVQLSDTEAFCYSVHEALQYGTAVIVTDLDVYKNVVVDGYNGYILNLDMSNIDVNKIVNNIPKDFNYEDNIENIKKKWFDVIGEPIYNKSDIKKEYVQVEVLEDFYDLVLCKENKIGEIIKVDKLRAYELCSINNNLHRKICKEL